MNERKNQSDILAKICKLQTEAVLKKMEELQYEIDNSSKPYIDKSYDELRNELKQKFKYKEEKYGGIVAVFCNTQEEFDFVKYFYRRAHSPSCIRYDLVEVGGDYDVSDWYFCEHQDIDYGMGAKDTKYWMESLAKKKRRFDKFCSEYK